MNLRITLFLIFAVLSGCGGSGSTDPANNSTSIPPPVLSNSAGGIWSGIRGNGSEVIMLVSELGEFRMLDEFGNVGFGQFEISSEIEVDITYEIAPPFMDTLIDGSDAASCTASGTIEERQSLNIVTACVTTLGGNLGGQIDLAYESAYDRDSSLATIAGNYDDFGDVLTIDAAGILFEQSAQNGCVVNGQVTVINAAWNLYNASLTIDSCIGALTPLNGSNWTGLVTVVDDQGTDFLIASFNAQIGTTTIGLVIALPKI